MAHDGVRTHLTTVVALSTCRNCNVLQPQSRFPIRATHFVSDRVLDATSRRAGMPDCKSTPVLVYITFVLLAGVFAQSTRDVGAAEECLSKPNSPAPQGQHWYYRVDHANGRQCWRLGPEGLRVQKSAPPSEKRAAPEASRSDAPVRVQRPVTAGTGNASAEVTPEANVTAAPPAYWLDAPRLLNEPFSVPPVAQPPSSIGGSVGSPDSPDPDDPPPRRAVSSPPKYSRPRTTSRSSTSATSAARF